MIGWGRVDDAFCVLWKWWNEVVCSMFKLVMMSKVDFYIVTYRNGLVINTWFWEIERLPGQNTIWKGRVWWVKKWYSGKYHFFWSSLLFLSFIMKDLILQVKFGLVKEKSLVFWQNWFRLGLSFFLCLRGERGERKIIWVKILIIIFER